MTSSVLIGKMARGRGRPKRKVSSLVSQSNGMVDTRSTGNNGEAQVMNEADVLVKDWEDDSEEEPQEIEIMEELDQKDKKLWVDVISGNRIPTYALVLGYSPPLVMEGKPVVVIVNEDVENELKYWKNVVVTYVLGKDLSMNAVKQFKLRYWNFVKLSELFYHDEGYFLTRFQNECSR